MLSPVLKRFRVKNGAARARSTSNCSSIAPNPALKRHSLAISPSQFHTKPSDRRKMMMELQVSQVVDCIAGDFTAELIELLGWDFGDSDFG